MKHPRSQPWHAINLEAVFEDLQATPNGLTASEANLRFEQVGANRLPRQSRLSRWQILLRQFRSGGGSGRHCPTGRF